MSNVTPSKPAETSPPRQSVIDPASNKTINSMGFWYLVVTGLFFYLLIATWPVLEGGAHPSGFKVVNVFGFPLFWEPDRQLMFTVIMAGAVGSLAHTLTSFGDYVGNRELSRNWIWFLILRIPIGMALAVLFYFIIRGGLLIPTVQVQAPGGTPSNATALLNPYSIAAFSALAGMFSKQATDKLASVFDVVFATKKPEREGALGSSQSLKVDPPSLTKGKREDLTVTGTGFQKGGTKATINGKDRLFDAASETSGTVKILDEDVNEKTTLKLVITNPNGDAFDATIEVAELVANIKPVILSTDPVELTKGSPLRSLPVSGQNFQNGCTATIDGEPRDTKFADGKITVTLLDKDLAGPGPLKLVVKNPGANGQASDAHNITVT
jgi:hypothetical protein